MSSLHYTSDGVLTARGSVHLSVQSLVTTIMGLLFFIVLARLVSPAEMGVYAGLTLTYGLFQTIGSLGLNVAASRFIPKLLAEGRKSEASIISTNILHITLLSASFFAFTAYALAPQLSVLLTKSLAYLELFKVIPIVVFLSISSAAVDGLMQGAREFGRLAIVRIVAQVFRVSASVGLLLTGYGLMAVIVGWMVFGGVLLSLLIPILRRNIGFSRGDFDLRSVVRFSGPVLGSNTILFISGWVDLSVVIALLTTSQAGIYNVTITAAGALILVLIGPAGATLLPAMSRAYGISGVAGVEAAFRRSTRYLALVYVPVAFGLASLATPVVALLAGGAYHESVIPLATVSLSSVFLAFATPVTVALTALGATGKYLKATAYAALVDTVTSLAAVPLLNVEGAAFGRVALFLGTLWFGLREARKVMSTSFDMEAFWKSLVAAAGMGFLLSVLIMTRAALPFLPFYALAGLVTYLAILRALGAVLPEDILIARRVLPQWAAPLVGLAETFFRANPSPRSSKG